MSVNISYIALIFVLGRWTLGVYQIITYAHGHYLNIAPIFLRIRALPSGFALWQCTDSQISVQYQESALVHR